MGRVDSAFTAGRTAPVTSHPSRTWTAFRRGTNATSFMTGFGSTASERQPTGRPAGTQYAEIHFVNRLACPPSPGVQILVGPHETSEAGRTSSSCGRTPRARRLRPGSKTRFSLAGDDGDAAGLDPRSMINEDTQAAITVEGLTKRYGELAAVDDLSFSVRRGAVTGFPGPNRGSGRYNRTEAYALPFSRRLTSSRSSRWRSSTSASGSGSSESSASRTIPVTTLWPSASTSTAW